MKNSILYSEALLYICSLNKMHVGVNLNRNQIHQKWPLNIEKFTLSYCVRGPAQGFGPWPAQLSPAPQPEQPCGLPSGVGNSAQLCTARSARQPSWAWSPQASGPAAKNGQAALTLRPTRSRPSDKIGRLSVILGVAKRPSAAPQP